MFVAQTLEDPLRRVSLLHRPSFVLCQDPLNHPDERIQLRARRRPVPPVARRHGKRQHLRHRAGVNAKAARRLPATDPLNPYRVADPRIKLHQLHPPAPCTQCKELPADTILLRRNRTASRFSEGFCLRRVHLCGSWKTAPGVRTDFVFDDDEPPGSRKRGVGGFSLLRTRRKHKRSLTWSDRAGSAGSLTLASGGKSKTDAIRGAGRTDLRLAGETQTKEKAIADAGLTSSHCWDEVAKVKAIADAGLSK